MSDHSAKPSEADVVNCYRTFLGREPESIEAVRQQLDMGAASVWDLISGFMNSDEARRRLANESAQRIFREGAFSPVSLAGTPKQIEQLTAHVRQVWSKYGIDDPYWSVLTGPQYRAHAMNSVSEEAFYASGRFDCDIFAASCRRNDVEQPRNGLIVDFGCGLARLGEHLSSDFARYLGVDISPPHLAMARDRLRSIGQTNFDFQLLPDFLDSGQSFDSFMSILVLQHNPPPIIALILKRLLSGLRNGGIGFFQVPCVLYGYNFSVQEYLKHMHSALGMEMHALPQHMVFSLLDQNNCRLLECQMDGQAGAIGLSYTFLVQKR